MRRIHAAILSLTLSAGIDAAQHKNNQAVPQFDPPGVLSAVEAVYPLQSVVSGTVVLEVSLDETGKIIDLRVVRGIASLTEPAERSLRQWKFQPAKLAGKPVPSKIPVAFSFVPPNVGPRV
jgi:TonB family protein